MIRRSQSSLQEDLDCKKIRASIDIVLITYLSTIPWRHIYLLVALTESRLFSRQLSDGFLSAFSRQPKISRFPWKKVKAPFLGLIKITFWTWKFYKCFSKIGGKFWFLKKMLNYLSFLVLLYVSGRFKQKKIFQNFSDW